MNLQDIDIIHPRRRRLSSIERKICARDNPSVNHQRDGTLSSQRPRLHDGQIPQCATNDLFAAAIGIAIGVSKKFMPPSSARLIMGRLLSPAVSMRDYRDLARQRSYSRAKSGNAKVGFS